MYRIFIGLWEDDGDHDLIIRDSRHLTWEAARNALEEHFRLFIDDDCEHCRGRAVRELERLLTTKPGRFESDIDGNDCIILEEHHRSTT